MRQPTLVESIGCHTLPRPELPEQHGRATLECWLPSLHCRSARFHTVALMLAACNSREQMSAPPSSDWHVNDSTKTKYLDQALWPQPARSDRLLERGGRLLLLLLTGLAGFGFAVTAAGILCCTSFGRGLCATATGPLPTPLAAGLSCAIYTLLLCAAY